MTYNNATTYDGTENYSLRKKNVSKLDYCGGITVYFNNT
jgi:hypothetical protein